MERHQVKRKINSAKGEIKLHSLRKRKKRRINYFYTREIT